jgi:hypothetical protein
MPKTFKAQSKKYPDKKNPKRNKWSEKEDQKLIKFMSEHPDAIHLSETYIESHFNRSKKQCRNRWTNYLKPGLNLSPLTPTEKKYVCHRQKEIGNKWATIGRELGRTCDMIKNFWWSRQRILRNIKKTKLDAITDCESELKFETEPNTKDDRLILFNNETNQTNQTDDRIRSSFDLLLYAALHEIASELKKLEEK